MTESALAVPPPSTPPREVKIAILLQAILFLHLLVTVVVAYAFYGRPQQHSMGTAFVLLFWPGIWALLLCGLWWRRNWARWLTVIFHVVVVSDALITDIAHDRGPTILSCLLIAIQVAVVVMLLRPVAGNWYGLKAG